MIKKIQYETETDKEVILNEHKDWYLLEVHNLFDGNFLILSDEKPIEVILNELKEVTEIISENQQDTVMAIAELTTLITTGGM